MPPIQLPSNRPADRFYRGGARIAAFRGEQAAPRNEPEDWVASVTTIAGEVSLGLTRLPDGELLADAIHADPASWLGPRHLARYGDDTRLLVKLLDAGQRLPVHAHPDAAFAGIHLGRTHGKAEAWYIVEGGEVHLGLVRDVGRHEFEDLVATQHTEALLALLHRRAVSPGDVVFVPAGVLHAIGEGVLLVELQEPEDLSILLEWKGFDLDGETDGHLGLSFPVALDAVEMRMREPHEIDALVHPAGSGASVLPAGSEPYFRLERHLVDGSVELAEGFQVLVVLDGELRDASGSSVFTRGTTALVPHSAGPLRLEGTGEVLSCRPPAA